MINVMLAKGYAADRTKAFPLYSSIKIDGVRGLYSKDDGLYTRRYNHIMGVEHITDILKPLGFSFDGELKQPGTDFHTTSGLVRRHSACPDMVYYVFDIPSIGNESFVERLKCMKELAEVLRPHPQIKFVAHKLIHTETGLFDEYLRVRSIGQEGLMLKVVNHTYQEGKRSWDWMKLKPRFFTEAVSLKVIGFYEGKGKHAGRLGGITVDHNGVPVNVGSGFDDMQREYVWQHRPEFLNAYADIFFHEVTKDGSLREPIFKGWRID